MWYDFSQEGGLCVKQTTKQTIQQSFHALLLAKSLDKITVRDIVEDCGLTRNTFYYHYEDIYDLFDDYLDTRIHEAWSSLPENCPWDQTLLYLLSSILETPQMSRHMFYSKKQDTLRRYLNRLLELMLDRYVLENRVAASVSAEDRRLICDACCYALYGMLEQWITGPDAAMFRPKLARLLQCFESAIYQALQYCSAHPEAKEDKR